MFETIYCSTKGKNMDRYNRRSKAEKFLIISTTLLVLLSIVLLAGLLVVIYKGNKKTNFLK